MTTSGESPLRVLIAADVADALAFLDPVVAVRDTLLLHARGETTLPDEAYLPWHTESGAFARSLALPATAVSATRTREAVEGAHPGRARAEDIVLSNPFGMRSTTIVSRRR